MKFNSNNYALSLLELAKLATKKEVPEIVDQFINFLIKTRQFKFIHRIIEQLEDLMCSEDGKVKVMLESSQKLDENSKNNILKFLNKDVDIVNFEEKIDPTLVGGAKIKINDLLIDATISNQLEKLRNELRA